MRFLLSSAVLASVASVAYGQVYNFLKDGGFEFCTQDGTPPDWTATTALSATGCANNRGNTNPHSGSWLNRFGASSSQGFNQATSMVAGDQYMISYFLAYAASPGATADTLQSSNYYTNFGPDVNNPTFQASPSSAQLQNLLDNPRVYQQFIYGPFTAQGNDILNIGGFANNNWYVVDDISVYPAGQPAATAVFNKAKARRDAAFRLKRAIEEPNCPKPHISCPIAGKETGYECLDPMSELTSCGGCASTGEGVDCTLAQNALGVGCEEGKCVTFSCQPGFKLGSNGVCA